MKARWASRLHTYQIDRANLHNALIRNKVGLARNVQMARKRFKTEQRDVGGGKASEKKGHALENVRARFE